MTATTTLTRLDRENPWPGLEAFDETARAFFHGRDREARELLRHVLDGPITVLFGRSGLGKTSLLRAGLFPLLRERRFLPVQVRFELDSAAAPLSRQLHQSVYDAVRANAPDAMLPSERETLWEYLHRADLELWSSRNYLLTPMIVLDQFEELFTLGERVPDLVRAFMNDLGDLAENRVPADLAARIDRDEAVAAQFHLTSHNYKLLISLREDFLPDLEGWQRRIPALGRSRMRLLPLRAAEALDAVHKPAAHLMTAALARRVVGIIAGEDLHRGRASALADVNHPGDELEVSDVDPALLSLFCRELNEERKRRGQPVFDEQLVEDAKDTTLLNYYSTCVSDMPERVAEFIESELITGKGFRNSYAREDAVPSRLTEDELAQLISSRLLRIVDHYGAQRIELTHDVLTGVVREHRDRRRAETEKEKEKAALAAHAEQERRALEDAAAQREKELESEKEAELHRAELSAARERQMTAEAHAATLRKRSRISLALVVVICVIAMIAAVGMVRATKAQQLAQVRLRFATAERLNAQAQGMLAGTTPGGDVRAFQQILAARLIAANPDGGVLYTAVVQRASTLKIITGHTGPVTAVAFSPDGHRLASAGLDGVVRLWNPDTGQPIGNPLTGHTDAVYGVAFSPDGHLLASAGADGTVRLWNPATGQPIGNPLTGHDGTVTAVAFSPDGHLLASAGADGTVRLWNPATGQPIGNPLTGHTDAVTAVAFSPDGQRLASASVDTVVRLWNPATGQPFGDPLTGHTGAVYGVAFSPDGQLLASASFDTTVRLWNPATGQPFGDPLNRHTAWVRGVAFSPDGQRLASASFDTTVRLWNPATGQPIGNPLTGHDGAMYAVAFSPDGHQLASASADGTVRLWNPDTGQPIGNPLTGHTDAAYAVAFSPDGHRLASAGADGAIRLWDAATLQPIGAPLLGHTGSVFGVAFSPDGHWLASAGADNTVRLWNPATGQPIGEPLTGHTGTVYSVVFSPDGQQLASASFDNTVRLWNPDTGQQIGAPLTGHTGAVTAVAFDPNGLSLASGGADATVRLWPASASSEMLCGKLTANMSKAQWRDWVSSVIPYTALCPGLPVPAEA